MKRYILLILLFLSFFDGVAQSISVKSFRALPMDMTASSLEGKRIDQNGQMAALIKVMTTETGFVFEGGTLGIVDTQQRVGEIWVWVPRGLRKITILHQQLGGLRDYRFPVEIEAERTYEMVLTSAKIETIIKEEVRQQYLTFQVSPANATLEVNDQLWGLDSDGIATKYVEFGTYTYRVRAADYFIEAGVVTVDNSDSTKIVTVTLKPDCAEITLSVDADAEIWVNNEKKGVRIWTGPMGNGMYKIECKQAGHETTMISKGITKDMNGDTIVLNVPRPIYGSLNVESNPNLATLYIDGKEIGKTPKSINEILVGSYEIKLTKDGYVDHTETIVINKGKRTQIKATLDKEGFMFPPTNSQQSQSIQQPSSVFFVMANAAYSIAPQTSFGLTVGSAKKLGWYVSLNSNFKFEQANFECDGSGNSEGLAIEYSFSDEKVTSRLSATAGMMFRLIDPLYAYAGCGYGYRNLLWESVDINGNKEWMKNTDYSYQGIAIDAGLMLHFRGFGFSLGVQTIGVKYIEAKIGLGYTLKKK